MARVFNTNVFNDVVVGATAVVTDPKFDELLASGDALAVQSVSDQVSGTSPTLTVVLEHSGDRRNWLAKTTLVSGAALVNTTTNVSFGSDAGTTPMLGFVRLKISLAGSTTPSARVQIYACGRTN